MKKTHPSLISLQAGRWFKLIGGASYQHLPAIRNLALAYTLAGADCIDVAADPAVVSAVKESFHVVSQLPQISKGAEFPAHRTSSELPLLMVSFSDGEDPHFRKAEFDPTRCPPDCSRPCEAICPAAAIAFTADTAGVIAERCYGCGRCLPVCPIQQIETVTRATAVEAIAATLLEQVDAIEIHTQVGRYDEFMSLWMVLQPHLHHLSVVSISCPEQAGVIDYLWQLYEGIQPLPLPLIWQTDGRPMSGDIGRGTTHATLRYARRMLQSGPPGYVQLAGGTNAHTAEKFQTLAREMSPVSATDVAAWPLTAAALHSTLGGVAFGSFARRLLSSVLAEWSTEPLFASAVHLEERPSCHDSDSLASSLLSLQQAVQLAASLVAPIKGAAGNASPWPSDQAGDRANVLATPAEPRL
ncbi:circadian clock protein LdpA [Halomicronema sp. CCY15110]|uniref:circadian clock protein LdpA n=1 Tax=Halomicronema sp. CCY15110 TaxID=2767773 RepID=UPI00194F8FD6|nr:LdpA C-terminal domain-containing domain [Halomicronema sp. CCY15110]